MKSFGKHVNTALNNRKQNVTTSALPPSCGYISFVALMRIFDIPYQFRNFPKSCKGESPVVASFLLRRSRCVTVVTMFYNLQQSDVFGCVYLRSYIRGLHFCAFTLLRVCAQGTVWQTCAEFTFTRIISYMYFCINL